MHYLAEFYLPGHDADIVTLAHRIRAMAEQANQTGAAVRFVNAIHAPEDESCFAIYEAATAEAVMAAGSLAGIAFDRIVEICMNDASDALGVPDFRPRRR
jgi:Nickel responsive protein SCO4226-like